MLKEHPNFFARNAALPHDGSKATPREVADIQANVPDGRVRCDAAVSRSRNPNRKGGIHMAKKAAKGAKKKAAKKK